MNITRFNGIWTAYEQAKHIETNFLELLAHQTMAL